MPRPIKVVFTRHAERCDKNKTGLTRSGLSNAKKQGKDRALAGQKVKRYSSYSKRALATAKKAQIGYNLISPGGYKLRARKDITTPVPNRTEWERMVREDFKGDKRAATLAWLRGKIPTDVVLMPEVFVKELIRKRVGLGKRIVRIGAKDLVLENFTHQELMLAIFEQLTGQKIDKLKKPLNLKYLESFTITFYKNGRASFRVRDSTYDITKRLSSIISK
jgi:hypothetical protein